MVTQTKKNIFTTNLFNNKTVFLIANNPNLSKETKQFLDNYNYNNSLVVRFNGYKKTIKDYCKGRTDVMVYRDNKKRFSGYNEKTYNDKIINVFTKPIEGF